MSEYTEDSIWEKDVRIVQHKYGYRFAIDAVLLAHFIKIEAYEEALEIGTGSGVIPVLLSRLKRFKKLTAVEIQKDLAELAQKNIQLNKIQNVQILHADARKLKNYGFDLIFSNPPYRKKGSGKLNPNQEKAAARHELNLRLEDVFESAAKNLLSNGRLTLILPTYREGDLIHLADQYKLQWQERQYVHSFSQEPPALLLATLGPQKCTFQEHPKLVIYDAPGLYTAAMHRLLTRQS